MRAVAHPTRPVRQIRPGERCVLQPDVVDPADENLADPGRAAAVIRADREAILHQRATARASPGTRAERQLADDVSPACERRGEVPHRKGIPESAALLEVDRGSIRRAASIDLAARNQVDNQQDRQRNAEKPRDTKPSFAFCGCHARGNCTEHAARKSLILGAPGRAARTAVFINERGRSLC